MWKPEGHSNTEHDEVSLADSLSLHLLVLNFISLPSSRFLVTSLNFYFALCLAASVFFILTCPLPVSLFPSLLFHFCPGFKMSMRNLGIDEVFSERQPSAQLYNRVRNGINQRIWQRSLPRKAHKPWCNNVCRKNGRRCHKIIHMLNMGNACVWNWITFIMWQGSLKKTNLNLFFLTSWDPFKCNQWNVKKKAFLLGWNMFLIKDVSGKSRDVDTLIAFLSNAL